MTIILFKSFLNNTFSSEKFTEINSLSGESMIWNLLLLPLGIVGWGFCFELMSFGFLSWIWIRGYVDKVGVFFWFFYFGLRFRSSVMKIFKVVVRSSMVS